MSYIHVDQMIEALCEPLARALNDQDPYVRKTAVLCVAKVYSYSPDMVESNNFLESLQNLLSDSNPMVRAT
jgi:AP-1 complex subunit beta-1